MGQRPFALWVNHSTVSKLSNKRRFGNAHVARGRSRGGGHPGIQSVAVGQSFNFPNETGVLGSWAARINMKKSRHISRLWVDATLHTLEHHVSGGE